jgi:hypothetical protein
MKQLGKSLKDGDTGTLTRHLSIGRQRGGSVCNADTIFHIVRMPADTLSC